MFSISIIMPCLNEQENILKSVERTIEALDLYGLDGELIVVNDGSTDLTSKIVKEYSRYDSRVKVIDNDRNLGIGASFFVGLDNATKELVTMFPGDNENDPIDALMYLDIMKYVDILIPFIHNIEVRSKFRRVISSIYRFLINISFGLNLNYTNGTVIYRRNILSQITPVSTGFFYQAEILIRLIRSGYVYAETPHFLNKRSSGKTKAISIKSLLNVCKSFLKLFYQTHVLRSIGSTTSYIVENTSTFNRLRVNK